MSNGLRSFADLALVSLFAAVAAGVVAIDGNLGPVRTLLGLGLVLFVPGYLFVATLYPNASPTTAHTAGRNRNTTTQTGRTRTLTGLERAVLSVLLSICIVPLLALAVDFTRFDVARRPVLAVVCGWILLFTILAAIRRLRLPVDRRFAIDFGGHLETGRNFFRQQPASLRRTSPFSPQNDTELVLNGIVVVGVLLLLVSVGFAAVADPGSESFSELYLLTENEDGEMVTEGFETAFSGGESVPLTVAVGNHEGETTEYSGVVLLQELSSDRTAVESEDELDRFAVTVSDGETETVDTEVLPSMVGEDLRLHVLLYTDDPPDDPSVDNAYRTVHLDITVS